MKTNGQAGMVLLFEEVVINGENFFEEDRPVIHHDIV